MPFTAYVSRLATPVLEEQELRVRSLFEPEVEAARGGLPN